MSGEHHDTTNYARANGLIPFSKAEYYGNYAGVGKRTREFRTFNDEILPVTATDAEIDRITVQIREWLTEEGWWKLYNNDDEYDIIACWKYLGLNPLDPALGVEDPFAEGFDDALG